MTGAYTRVLLLCAVMAGSGQRLPAQAPDVSLPAEPVEIRLEPYFRELRTVQVVSGVDTLRLLLDTGGGHTLVTPEAARRLGCDPFGRTIGHRMSGERVTFQWCADVALHLGGVFLGSGPIAVFDLGAVLPRELPALDGLLSLKSFANLVVTFDLQGERLILESARSSASRRETQQPLVARVATGEDGSSLTLLLAAKAEPQPAWLLLDSGNLLGTILSPTGVLQVNPRAGRPRLDETVGLDLEVVGLPAVPTSATIGDVIYDGVLGARFFFGHQLTFDLRGRTPWVGAAQNAQ